jgi:hypothetical protein
MIISLYTSFNAQRFFILDQIIAKSGAFSLMLVKSSSTMIGFYFAGCFTTVANVNLRRLHKKVSPFLFQFNSIVSFL